MLTNETKIAFTLTETLIVITIIALIVAITVLSTLNLDRAKEKKMLSVSQSFYTNVSNTYTRILFQQTSNGSIINLFDANNDGVVDSLDLRSYFVKYMDGENTPCSDLENTSPLITDYLTNAQCAIFSPNVVAGFYLDKNCSLKVNIKEYLTDSHESKVVENSCGIVTYGLSDSKGSFTYDIFTIALGKRGIK